jgi:hypothetical protein
MLYVMRSMMVDDETLGVGREQFQADCWDGMFEALKIWLQPGAVERKYQMNDDWIELYGGTHLVLIESIQRRKTPVGIHFFKWIVRRPWIMMQWRNGEYLPFTSETHTHGVAYWLMEMQEEWCQHFCREQHQKPNLAEMVIGGKPN